MANEWHTGTAQEAVEALASSSRGLSGEEAARRLERYGPNEIQRQKRESPLLLFLGQFKNFLVIMLLVAVILSLLLGEVVDSVVILIIVLFATILGFVQEYRAERALDALKEMSAPTATAIRDGATATIPARELVPGDVISLKAGDRIPADGRILVEANLRVEEAPLTGESVPAEKTSAALSGTVPVADRRNMVYAGTTAVYGRGTAIVTATGMSTEVGKIAGMLEEVEERRTPLQESLDRMAKAIALGAIALIIPLVAAGILRGHGWIEMVVWGVSLAVAAVPEALAAVVTIGLAIGVQRMAKRNALVRKLPAVETLGCTTVICSDKTGTLTQDRMTVRRLLVAGSTITVSGVGYEAAGGFERDGRPIDPREDPAVRLLLQAGALCNDSEFKGPDSAHGDPTELALVVLAAKAGFDVEKWKEEWTRISEIPFSSETKRMTTVHDGPQGRVSYSKGAPELILGRCATILDEGGPRPLTQEDRETIAAAGRGMAADALRVLGLAYSSPNGGPVDDGMTFLGLAGMIDPPRPEAAQAIRVAREAGIKPVMITGDHKVTASSIARELGLLTDGLVLEGAELDGIGDEELREVVLRADVYARVSPAHKLRIVEALQRNDRVVAMTGDGVNDAPALKKADIGIAMGITGTDVSKEAAKIVLTDDNFASIVAAIEEGRAIFDNIKKFLVYLLSCNLGEVLLMALGVLIGSWLGLAGGALPLTAIQILYVNLATDGLPGIALSLEPKERDLMRRAPRRRTEGVFTKLTVARLTFLGISTCLAAIASIVYSAGQGRSVEEIQGFCFVTLILIQIVNAFNCRSLFRSLFTVGPFSNRWLVLAVIWECALLALLVYLPPLQNLFHTSSLGTQDWLVSILLALSILGATELIKLYWRSRRTI